MENQSHPMGEPRYAAFISYAHADQEFAGWLERSLERYVIPRAFRTGARHLNVFRDVPDAGVGDLPEVLRNALDRSDHLIVVCSEHARASRYVGEEISYFASTRGPERIVLALVSGRPNREVDSGDERQDQAFPEALDEIFEEPLAADFRGWTSHGNRWTRRARFREPWFQIVAALLGTEKTEELVGRDRRRSIALRAVAAVVFVTLAGAAGWRTYDAIPRPGIALSRIADGEEWSQRARDRVLVLREALRRDVPDRRKTSGLLLATWSLRDFGKRGASSPRQSGESLSYIAEIISSFDLVALQELSGAPETFDPVFAELRSLLGPHWQSVVSGLVEGRLGNLERLGFLYDSRKVEFADFTDEVVLSPEQLEKLGLGRQIARTPFMAGFRIHGQKLLLCNVHGYWGRSAQEGLETRAAEARAVAEYLRRARLWSDTLVLAGTFNSRTARGPVLTALRDTGFTAPLDLEAAPTDSSVRYPYDQLLLGWSEEDRGPWVTAGGVFDFTPWVYTDGDLEIYANKMPARPRDPARPAEEPAQLLRRYRMWRTYQVSDHLPKWAVFMWDRVSPGKSK